MRRIISGLLAVCCTLTLAACSHGAAANLDTSDVIAPTPATAAPRPSSASQAGSATASQTAPLLTGHGVRPGEVPPTISAYVNHDTASGALAFAAYFDKALDWSIATSNPNLLRPISAPTCTACQKYIHGLDALAAAGGYSRGGRIAVSSFTITTGNAVKADFVVEVTIHQSVEVVVSPGSAPRTYPPVADPLITYVYMSWKGSGWQAEEVTQN